ncbi:trace amine-associated receptor 8c-like [Sphaeramia orbicularis]|uniref:trace amine-associated receptor 8c-like n=1 Tax=Sphaeramia orbicularis TaxID=375764 RepID=UPI0011800EEF|nr:trace amine-associated receptor 8c-like [Sphaeramia orbicularis]
MELTEPQLCFPMLLNTSCRRQPARASYGMDVLSILLFFMAVVTAFLNLLVIISISHFRQLHSSTNSFLLSLAVSDFLIGMVVVPIEVQMTSTCWYLGDLLCALYFIVPITLIMASVGTMVLISVDRYVAICDPLRYQTRITIKVVNLSICLCWTCAVIYSVCLLHENLEHPGRFNSCFGECVVNINGEVDLVVGCILPVSVVIVLYTRVFKVVLSQVRAMRCQVSLPSATGNAKMSEVKAATSLGVVVLAFLFCYIPYYLVTMSGGHILIGSLIESYTIFIVYFNSCLNPVIYALFCRWFRTALKLIVTLQILKPGSCHARLL